MKNKITGIHFDTVDRAHLKIVTNIKLELNGDNWPLNPGEFIKNIKNLQNELNFTDLEKLIGYNPFKPELKDMRPIGMAIGRKNG